MHHAVLAFRQEPLDKAVPVREQRRGQAELGVVHDPHGIVEIVIFQNAKNRPENLHLPGRAVMRHITKNCRAVEITTDITGTIR